MKKIYQLILKSYIGPFIVTFLISLFILLMQFLWKWIEDLIGKGLEWNVITEIMFYASAGLVPMALPLAVLLASVMTFGNFAEHYELSAMKSAGMPLPKIMKPLIIFTLLISIGAFFFSNNALPYTNLKMARVLYDVQRKNPELNIKTGVFNDDIKGYSIKIGHKKNGMMYDFMIYDHTKNKGNKEVTVADSGTIKITENRKFLIFTLYNGYSYIESPENKKKKKDKKNVKEYPHRKDQFSKEEVIFRLEDSGLKKSDEGLWRNNYQMMRLKQLEKAIDTLRKSYNLKKPQLYNRIMKYNYFKNEYKVRQLQDTTKVLKDSLIKYADPQKLQVALNTDSIFDKMTKPQKITVIDKALKDAKKVKNDVEVTYKITHDRLRWLRKHELAWYQKFSLSFACLIFFFVGAPLGAIIKKGGFGMPFLVSIILFMLYYVISITGEKFAKEDVLPVVIGAWLSSAILFPLGVFITYKASRDATLINTSKFKAIFKSIQNIYKRFF